MSFASTVKGGIAKLLAVLLLVAAGAAWWQYTEARRAVQARDAARLEARAAGEKADAALAASREQAVLIDGLRRSAEEARLEKERYMKVFADHDLERLLRAKPGLMERRINKGTIEVYRELAGGPEEAP